MRKETFNSEQFIQDIIREYGFYVASLLFTNSVIEAFNNYNRATSRYINYQVKFVDMDEVCDYSLIGTNNNGENVYVISGLIHLTNNEDCSVICVPFGVFVRISFMYGEVYIEPEDGDYDTSYFSDKTLSSDELIKPQIDDAISDVLSHMEDLSYNITNKPRMSETQVMKEGGLSLSDILGEIVDFRS